MILNQSLLIVTFGEIFGEIFGKKRHFWKKKLSLQVFF
jgi:hypothetical protein